MAKQWLTVNLVVFTYLAFWIVIFFPFVPYPRLKIFGVLASLPALLVSLWLLVRKSKKSIGSKKSAGLSDNENPTGKDSD